MHILCNKASSFIVCIGVSAPPHPFKNTPPPPLIFAKLPLKPRNCPSPPFWAVPQIYWFFMNLPPKLDFSVNPYNFSSLAPTHLLKVTQILVKFSQFKFLINDLKDGPNYGLEKKETFINARNWLSLYAFEEYKHRSHHQYTVS